MNYEITYIRDGSDKENIEDPTLYTAVVSERQYHRVQELPWIKVINVQESKKPSILYGLP